MAKLLNFLLLAICGTITAAEPSIPALATSDDDLSTLVTALKAANLVSALSEPGPFTVFAPTNEAFAMVPPDALKTLLKPENVGKLTGVLTYRESMHAFAFCVFST